MPIFSRNHHFLTFLDYYAKVSSTRFCQSVGLNLVGVTKDITFLFQIKEGVETPLPPRTVRQCLKKKDFNLDINLDIY